MLVGLEGSDGYFDLGDTVIGIVEWSIILFN